MEHLVNVRKLLLSLAGALMLLTVGYSLPAAQGQETQDPSRNRRVAELQPGTPEPDPVKITTITIREKGSESRQVPMWRQKNAIFYRSKMNIDLDGAPNAYHPPTPQARHGKGPGLGLDDLRNATKNLDDGPHAIWVGVVTDDHGTPIIQDQGPFAGFYVSQTSLQDRTFPKADPRRYVDATKIPYVVLNPIVRDVPAGGPRLGDIAAVVVLGDTPAVSFGIIADIGPKGKLGEASLALAKALGIPHGTDGNVMYILFPGSGDGKPKTPDEIAKRGSDLFVAWGGLAQVTVASGLH